jgi:hydrogenase maturation protease
MPTTYVLALGNVLMSDDGLGPAVLRAFEQHYVAGPNVVLEDLGTPGLDLSPWLADAERVILIDTIKAPLPPGSMRLYTKADLVGRAAGVRVSPHDPGVRETLLALEFAGRAPREVALIGVVPALTTMGLDLSAEVQAAIPAAVQAVVTALADAGIDVVARTPPLSPVPWWNTGMAGIVPPGAAAGKPAHR